MTASEAALGLAAAHRPQSLGELVRCWIIPVAELRCSGCRTHSRRCRTSNRHPSSIRGQCIGCAIAGTRCGAHSAICAERGRADFSISVGRSIHATNSSARRISMTVRGDHRDASVVCSSHFIAFGSEGRRVSSQVLLNAALGSERYMLLFFWGCGVSPWVLWLLP